MKETLTTMWKFLKEMWMPDMPILSGIMSFFLCLYTIIVSGIFIGLLYVGVNNFFGETKVTDGVIAEVTFQAAHEEHQCSRGCWEQVDDRYWLLVTTKDGAAWMPVPSPLVDWTTKGKHVAAKYVVGFFDREISLRQIDKP